MKTGRVRRLTMSDTDDILRIVELEELNTVALTRELTAGDDYLWVGLDSPAGGLGAVHRSMRWGNHLLLKGVFVDDSPSPAARHRSGSSVHERGTYNSRSTAACPGSARSVVDEGRQRVMTIGLLPVAAASSLSGRSRGRTGSMTT